MQDIAATTARLLSQGRGLDHLSRGLTLIGALVVFFGSLPWIGAAIVVAGLVQSWFALRVGFDAALFAALGRGEGSMSALDAALISLGLMPETASGRAIAPRIAGAKRLLAWQAFAVMAQAGLCLVAALLRSI